MSAEGVIVSEKAVDQIKRVQERESKQSFVLRLSVVGGGCSGLSYKMAFEEAPKEGDTLYDFAGIKVAVDPRSLLFLKGMTLDFSDGLNGQGFVFNNPNAKTSCGCGSSFSA
jgi:iron-sulfur cluster assembly protein